MLKADAEIVKVGFVTSLERTEQDLGGWRQISEALGDPLKYAASWVHYHYISTQIIKGEQSGHRKICWQDEKAGTGEPGEKKAPRRP